MKKQTKIESISDAEWLKRAKLRRANYAKRINKNGVPLKDAYSKHVEELFDEICEIFSDAEARTMFAAVILKPRIDKRSLKPFNWRDFKPTDYVPRETKRKSPNR